MALIIVVVKLLDANPEYARVQFQDGRESTVFLQHLAPIGLGRSEKYLDEDENDHNLAKCSQDTQLV